MCSFTSLIGDGEAALVRGNERVDSAKHRPLQPIGLGGGAEGVGGRDVLGDGNICSFLERSPWRALALSGAGGADAPPGTFDLADDGEVRTVDRSQTGRHAGRAVDVGNLATVTAHQVMMVVAESSLVSCDRAGRLEATHQTHPA